MQIMKNVNYCKQTLPLYTPFALLLTLWTSQFSVMAQCNGYVLERAKICSAINGQNADCAQEINLYAPGVDVPQTLILLSGVSGTMAVRFVWYRPDGTEYFRQTTGTFNGGCGSYWFTYNLGAIPAGERNMGTWRVDFQVSHNGTAFRTIASPTFEVGCYCTLEYPPRLVCTQDGRIMTACAANCAGIPNSSNLSNCCDLTTPNISFTPSSCSSTTGNLTVSWNKSVIEDFGYDYDVVVRNTATGISYSANTPLRSIQFNNVPTGTYTVEVGINGCKRQTQYSAVINRLSLTTNPVNPSCGFSNGSITTSTSGGTSPYRYSWSTGATTANLSNLAAGSFFVTVTDQRGCTATQSNTLRANIATPSAPSTSNVTANSVNLSWPSLSGVASYRIEYRLLNSSLWNSATSNTNAYSLSGLSANSDYEVRITALCGSDAGTPSGITRFKTLNPPQAPTVRITSPLNGATFITPATFTVQAEASDPDGSISRVDFYRNNALIATDNTAPYTYPINGLSAGTYIFEARAYDLQLNQGISSPVSVIVYPPCNLDFGFSANSPACDQTNGSLTVSVSSGVFPYRYAWSNGASTATLNNIGAGTYQVTVTDNQGCPLIKSFTLGNIISNPTQITVSNITQTTAGLVWNANSSSYRLEYRLSSVSNWTGVNVFTNSFTLTGLSPNSSYQVRVFGMCNTQVSTNSVSTNFTTLATQAPTVSIITPVNNARFNAPANIGILAEASDPDSPVERVEFYSNNTLIYTDYSAPYSFTMQVLSPGTYNLEARAYDANQNRGTSTPVSIIVNPPCNLNFEFSSSAPACDQANGSITVNVSSGISPFRYAWSNGASTATLNNIGAGTYQVTVTDNQGCPLIKSFTLNNVATNPTQITVSNITQTSAGLIWNASSSSYRLEYKLSSASNWIGVNVSTNSFTLTELSPNSSYQVRIFGMCNAQVSTNSVSTNFTTLVTQAPTVRITTPTNNARFNAPANVDLVAEASDPDSPVERVEFYSNNALIYTDYSAPYSFTMQGLAQGTYNFEARAYDANQNRGTSTSVSIIVNPPCNLNFSLSASATTCGLNNGKIEITNLVGATPFSYSWSTGASSNVLTNLGAGTYQLTITDANRCQFNNAATVAASSKPVPSLVYEITSKGLSINISNTSTQLDKWFWNFGDSNTSQERAPAHLYTKAGTYVISGYAENTCERIEFIPRSVTVAPEIEEKDKMHLWLGKAAANPGGEIVLPLRMRNFKEVVGVQFTLKLNSNHASIIEVLPNALFKELSFLKFNNQTYSFIWLPDPPQYHSFADSTKMLDLKIKLSATMPVDSCVQITFVKAPTDLIAFQRINGVDSEQVPVVESGEVCAEKVSVGNVEGEIVWKEKIALANIPVTLKSAQNYSTLSNHMGRFAFNAIPLNQLYTLMPSFDVDHLNGVNISDVLALRQHVLGVKRIVNPSALIAADVNNSKTINLADIVAMMRLILGEMERFPDQPSWRFIPTTFLTDPQKKWTDLPFDYSFRMDSVSKSIGFTGIKVGDITQSAQLRSNHPEVALKMSQLHFESDQNLVLPLHLDSRLSDWQFDLGFDQTTLRFQGLKAGTPGLELRYQQLANGRFSVLVHNQSDQNVGTLPLTLYFTTLRTGHTHASIQLLSDRIEPLALINGEEHHLSLVFEEEVNEDAQKNASWNHLVIPNPVGREAVINLSAPINTKGLLKIFDLNGKCLRIEPIDLMAGLNPIKIKDISHWMSGLYTYQILLDWKVLHGSFLKGH